MHAAVRAPAVGMALVAPFHAVPAYETWSRPMYDAWNFGRARVRHHVRRRDDAAWRSHMNTLSTISVCIDSASCLVSISAIMARLVQTENLREAPVAAVAVDEVYDG